MKYKFDQLVDCLWGGIVGLVLGCALMSYTQPQVEREFAPCDLQHDSSCELRHDRCKRASRRG